MPAFGGVIEDDVEDDFDSGAMERLDHVPEFVEDRKRFLARAVRVMRRKERDRLVSPVVHAARRRMLRIELKHRQQLHGGDAQVLQVGNLLDQAGVGPSLPGRHPGAGMPGEAADVKLVDDRLGERAAESAHRLPSRSRRDPPRRSSSRMRRCRRAASRRPGRRCRGRRRRGRRGRGGLSRHRTGARGPARTVRGRGRRRSVPPGDSGRRRASSDTSDARSDRAGSPAPASSPERRRTGGARPTRRSSQTR